MRITRPVVALTAVCCLASAQTGPPRYQPGDAVQDETFTTVEGQTLRLSEFQGRPLLLAFFTDG